MTEMWQFSDEDITAVVMKMLQWTVRNVLRCEKNRKSQQRNKRHEEKSNENFRTEKDNNWKKKISPDGLNSKMEMNQWIWRYNHKNSPIWSTERKINEWKKRKTDSQGPVGLTKELTFYVFEIPVESKEEGNEKVLDELITANFLRLGTFLDSRRLVNYKQDKPKEIHTKICHQISENNFEKKENRRNQGASLVVQWLRICLCNARDTGSIPGPGRFHTMWGS